MAKERWKTLGSGEERAVASIPRRLGARLIDDLVGVGVFVVIVRPLSSSETVVGLIFALLVLLCLFLYEVAMIAIWGRTIGKWAVDIEVVRVEDGSVLGWWRSIGRWAVLVLPRLVLADVALLSGLYTLVLFLSVVFHPDRQGWHDRVGDTMVARIQPEYEQVRG